MTRIIIALEGTYRDYAETLKHSADDAEHIKDLLMPYGFERTDLKTLSFDVETKYESYKVMDEYKSRFAGYEYTHVMKVDFESDNHRLGKILYMLAQCPVKPEFRIKYTVKDPEAAKNELLGKAVSDALDKAKTLTRAAEVVLGNIQSIDYSWGEVNFEFQPMNKMMSLQEPTDFRGNSYDLDIEPDDIEVSDTVTVIWEIK